MRVGELRLGEGQGSSEVGASAPSPHFLALDGMRGVAVILVVVFHLGHLGGGYLGVDLFFAISGFLITRVLLTSDARSMPRHLGRFYLRRVRRLLPALAVMVATTIVLALVLFPTQTSEATAETGVQSLLYYSNWASIADSRDYFTALSDVRLFEHTWSLSIEEQFYLLWPALLLVTGILASRGGTKRLWMVLGATQVVLLTYSAYTLAESATEVHYYSTISRSFTILCGAAAFAYYRTGSDGCTGSDGAVHNSATLARAVSRRWSGLVLGAFYAALVLAGPELLPYGQLEMAAVVGGLLVLHGIYANHDWLNSKPIVAVGRLSYSIYLWHWPIIVFVREIKPQWPEAATVSVILVLTAAAACASYALIEEPFRRGLSARTALGALLPAYAGVLAIAVIFSGSGPTPYAELAVSDVAEDPQLAGRESLGSLLVLGDSQAVELLLNVPPAEIPVGTELSFDLTLGCGLGPGYSETDVFVWVEDYEGRVCADVVPEWMALINSGDFDKVIVYTGAWDVLDRQIDGQRVRFSSPEWSIVLAEHLDLLAREFSEADADVYWMATACFYDVAGARTMEDRIDLDRTARYNELLREAASRHGVPILPYDELTCDEPDPDRRWDGVHPVDAGAIEIWRWMLDEVGQ